MFEEVLKRFNANPTMENTEAKLQIKPGFHSIQQQTQPITNLQHKEKRTKSSEFNSESKI